jgi:hypothetical protein
LDAKKLFSSPSKPSERSAKQMGDNMQVKSRQGGQPIMGYEEVMNMSNNQRSNFNTGVDKGNAGKCIGYKFK